MFFLRPGITTVYADYQCNIRLADTDTGIPCPFHSFRIYLALNTNMYCTVLARSFIDREPKKKI